VAASIRIMTVTAPSVVTEKRFAFGRNWRGFLSVLDEGRIAEAEKSLQEMLETVSLQGRSFLDVGSGSGLFSLAAARLGASKIRSFDFDPESVACTAELKRRYRPEMPEMEDWIIERGNVLDQSYLASLGRFDIVYSWGVLHHTGELWRALGAVTPLVAPGSTLFIAVYNDRGWVSKAWRLVKRIYNSGPVGRFLVIGVFIPVFAAKGLGVDVLTFRNPVGRYRRYRQQRGMSIVYDWLDWLGGLPYEVAKPDEITQFLVQRSFRLRKMKPPLHKNGNNEFVFLRQD
jgi:SAM-dependent methyltransferase